MADEQTQDDRVAKERAEMRAAWTKGRDNATQVAEHYQSIGDTLADYVGQIWQRNVPKADPAEWYESDWPEGGVEVQTVRRHLERAMAGVYALAGAYRRAASGLDAALRVDDAALGEVLAAKYARMDEVPW